MGDIIPIKTINAPALASAFGYQESDLSDGAMLGFPVLSYRGKVWRVTHKGDAQKLLTPDGDPIPSVRVIILRANKNLSKIYYEKRYQEGDDSPPDCFSVDGEAPDSSAKSPQSVKCATCPQAAWGSRVTDDGREVKACQDSRRLVVVPAADVRNEALGGPMLLRVPAASLGNLAAYDGQLKKANAAYFGVATKIYFDSDAAYPKLVFEYDGASTEKLSKADAEAIMELRDSEAAQRILQKSIAAEHMHAAEDGDTPAKQPAKQPAKEPARKPKATAPVEEVTEEEDSEELSPSDESSSDVELASESDVDALVDGLLRG